MYELEARPEHNETKKPRVQCSTQLTDYGSAKNLVTLLLVGKCTLDQVGMGCCQHCIQILSMSLWQPWFVYNKMTKILKYFVVNYAVTNSENNTKMPIVNENKFCMWKNMYSVITSVPQIKVVLVAIAFTGFEHFVAFCRLFRY